MPTMDHDRAITDFARSLDTPLGHKLLMVALTIGALLWALHWLATRPKALRLKAQHRRLMRRVRASRA